MEEVGRGRTTPRGWATLAALLGALLLGARGLWKTRIAGLQATALVPVVLAATIVIAVLRDVAGRGFAGTTRPAAEEAPQPAT